MIALFRRFLNTWAARAFFMIVALVFALYGIPDVVRGVWRGNGDVVATVGGRSVTTEALDVAYRQQLAQLARAFGQHEVPDALRVSVARQALERLISQEAVQDDASRLGIAVPDEALRQAIFAIPAFAGPGGTYDRGRMEQALAANNLTEGKFIELVRADLAQKQVLETVKAGAGAPRELVRRIYEYQQEKRAASMVAVSTSSMPDPPSPSDAQLQRQYANNPERYSTPELRHLKLILLSPATIARSIDISDEDARRDYDQHQSIYATAETRSLQVITADNQAKAEALATLWKSGLPWETLQQAAEKEGAATVALDDATPSQIPSETLAKAAFAAPADTVMGPEQAALGWQIYKVSKITPATHRSFEDAKAEIKQRIALERAADLVDARYSKLQDTLAGGASLDEIPADLGAFALSGSIDAQGDTAEGQPAPIPGSEALRKQIVAASFAAKEGERPSLTQGADQSAYALVVDKIDPPAPKPFDTVRAQVEADWRQDQLRHAAETEAAGIYKAVHDGKSLADAVADVPADSGALKIEDSPAILRGTPPAQLPPGFPERLAPVLFTLKTGEPTMVETLDGFVVATAGEVQMPDPAADPLGFGRTTDGLRHEVSDDVEMAYAGRLREAFSPSINQSAFASVVRP